MGSWKGRQRGISERETRQAGRRLRQILAAGAALVGLVSLRACTSCVHVPDIPKSTPPTASVEAAPARSSASIVYDDSAPKASSEATSHDLDFSRLLPSADKISRDEYETARRTDKVRSTPPLRIAPRKAVIQAAAPAGTPSATGTSDSPDASAQMAARSTSLCPPPWLWIKQCDSSGCWSECRNPALARRRTAVSIEKAGNGYLVTPVPNPE